MDEYNRIQAVIDTAALRHNLGVVRRMAARCGVVAVVKGDGYGHGLAAVCGALVGAVEEFAVATLEEGVACRAVVGAVPVSVLSGLVAAGSLAVCERYRLTPVVHSAEHLAWLEAYRGAPLGVWLKVDSGMNRLGIAPGEVVAAVARLRGNRRVAGVRLMTHLACADEPGAGHTEAQLGRFFGCTEGLGLERSVANSAGVMAWPRAHCEWVRPGIMLYGGSPLAGRGAGELGLRPVMELRARLVAVKTVGAGERVGYGGAFVAAAGMRVGVVGCGYGDGYPRGVGNMAVAVAVAGMTAVAGTTAVVAAGTTAAVGTAVAVAAVAPPAVLIGETRARLVGRVSMDTLTVDLSHHPHAAVGDEVILWGAEPGVDEVAAWAGGIGHEILCRLGQRVPRIARGG